MKKIEYLTAAALLLATPVLAQASFTTGQKVEAYNSTTGKWETATITQMDGYGPNARYLLHSDSSSVVDWDVGSAQVRAAGSAVSNASTSPAAINGGVSGSGAASSGAASGGASVGAGAGGVIGGANAGVGVGGSVTTP